MEPGVEVLLCRVGDGAAARLVALPIDDVVETMRPQPVRPLPGLPRYVTGVAMVRGAAVPVVDLALLLDVESRPGRFVSLEVGGRTLAVAVTAVLDVRRLDKAGAPLDPLLGAMDGELVESVGTLDPDLLLVLRSSRLVPEDVWAAWAQLADAGQRLPEPAT